MQQVTQVHGFSTDSWFLAGNKFHRLYRGHALERQFNGQEALKAAIKGAEYLYRTVDDDGKFDYLFRPGIESEAERYNLVRHAGTTFALLEVYQVDPDETLLAAARRTACRPPSRTSPRDRASVPEVSLRTNQSARDGCMIRL